MASEVDVSKTPTKISKFVNISPRSRGIICIICGSSVNQSRYRRKLYNDCVKTDACLLIEKTLKVQILFECSTHIVCRNCHRDITRIDEKVNRLLHLYEDTTRQLYEGHGSAVIKRLRNDQEESCESRRKSLFKGSTDSSDGIQSLFKGSTESSDGIQSLFKGSTESLDGIQSLFKGSTESLDGIHVVSHSKTDNSVQVTLTTNDGLQLKRTVIQPLSRLAIATTTPDFSNLSTLIFSEEVLRPFLLSQFCNELKKEVASICSKEKCSLLRSTNATNLHELTFDAIAEEWKVGAPIFWSVIEIFSSNPKLKQNKVKTAASVLPALVSAGSKLLSIYNRDLNALQHLNNIILLKGGSKRSTFNRLHVTNDCTTYRTAFTDIEELAKGWDTKIKQWQLKCETDHSGETALIENVKKAEEYVIENGRDSNSVLLLDEEEKTLESYRKHMHPGYYIVGDNVDFYTKVRTMTTNHQNKSQHMFQICAYKNRVSGNMLDDSKPQCDPEKVKFSTLLPTKTDQALLIDDLAFIVAHKWTELIPALQIFRTVLPDIIPHKYMAEMKAKSERINLGVLERNEQYNDEMTQICKFIHKFVPGHSENEDTCTPPQKVLSGGDYLTFERHKQAQVGMGNDCTPSLRLEGLVPKIEEFHNQAELLKLIWRMLYNVSSSSSVGTLYASRNKLNATNVPQDPHGNFYASAEFMDKVSTAYIIAGGLHHFGMDNLQSRPKQTYEGPIGDKDAMKQYIMENAVNFVKTHGTPSVPELPKYCMQSRELVCRYCNKEYIRPKSLRKHEAKVHGQEDPIYNPRPQLDAEDPEDVETKSTVYDYTKLCLTLGLLRLNHDDAIKMGDGERMLRIEKFLCLYYKAGKCPKYAYALLETIAQARVLLSARQAERLLWNRTVNHQGTQDGNHPNDLDLEHCNKVFKESAHTYRGKYTEKTILRVSRSALSSELICKQFDKKSNVKQSSAKHTKKDVSEDILLLADQLHVTGKIFQNDDRSHEHFPNVKDPLNTLNKEDLVTWISSSMNKFTNGRYYGFDNMHNDDDDDDDDTD